MGTEVITYSRIGKEDIRFGTGTFEVVLADGRKVTLNEVDIGAILNNADLSTSPMPEFDLRRYGAVPDGTTDTSPFLLEALDDAAEAGGGEIHIVRAPEGGTYRFESAVPSGRLPANVVFRGFGTPVLSKAFNGDWFPSTGAKNKWVDLYVDMNGATYTGAFVLFEANSSGQEIRGCEVVNGADSILLYEPVGGSGCHIHHNWFTTHTSMPLTSAVVKRTETTFEVTAAPRFFDHNMCYGPNTLFANVNGFHGFYVDSIYSNGITLGDNTANALITNCRFAMRAGDTLTASGSNVTIAHNNIGSTGTYVVAAGFLYGKFVNNTMDSAMTFTDNSIKTNAVGQPFVEDPTLATGRQVPIFLSANIPVGATAMDGRLLISNDGVGASFLYWYKGGERYRAAGTLVP
jgi:hypothetical protein